MIRENIDREWELTDGQPLGSVIANIMMETPCRIVNLPHDFTIETDPFPESPGHSGTGYYGGEIKTYTKMLDIPDECAGKRVIVEFDGSYMNTTVILNGHTVDRHLYGYTPFHVDLTSYIKPGKSNRLTVIVNNSAMPNSRWYSGSGIYRHVDLLCAPKIHMSPWGIYAHTSHILNGTAFVIVETTVENHTSDDANLWVDIKLVKEACGTEAGTGKVKLHIPAGEKSVGQVMIAVENADIWDIDSPNLYTIKAQLTDKETVLDSDSTLFGITTISVDPINGFTLNGRSLKLKGGCVHHDNGILGAASFKDSEYRKMKVHKDNEYNAIRCAHNPPSRDMLDACDRLGLLVINEAFDMWTIGKNANDYSLYFKENWEKDIESFILRDRNHPCIIMWSTGNEIHERGGLSNGYQWSAKLAAKVRELDPTRLVTSSVHTLLSGLDDDDVEMCKEEIVRQLKSGETIQNFDTEYGTKVWADYTEAFCAPLDAVGYNYLAHRYEEDGKKFPNRVIYAGETKPMQMATYWDGVERYSHVIGDFNWTSHDYLGEAGLGKAVYQNLAEADRGFFGTVRSPYPWRVSNCSDFDLCGFVNPQHFYRRIVWGSDMTYIASHNPKNYGKKEIIGGWGWPERENSWSWLNFEGKPIQVDVYSAAEEVELILNGKSLGKKPAGKENSFTATFDITYEPGTLEAVSYTAGKKVSSDLLKSSEKPVGIQINLENNELTADGQSLAFAVVEIIDADGNLVPTAEMKATAKVEGSATLAAFGTGNPQTKENYTKGEFTSYKGRLLAIVRAGYEPGTAILTISIDGLKTVSVEIPVK